MTDLELAALGLLVTNATPLPWQAHARHPDWDDGDDFDRPFVCRSGNPDARIANFQIWGRGEFDLANARLAAAAANALPGLLAEVRRWRAVFSRDCLADAPALRAAYRLGAEALREAAALTAEAHRTTAPNTPALASALIESENALCGDIARAVRALPVTDPTESAGPYRG